jgi:hypothetical protein
MPSKIEHAKVNKLVFNGSTVGYRFSIYYIGGEQKVYDIDKDNIKPEKLVILENLDFGKDANLVMRVDGDKLITFQDTSSSIAIEDISDKPVIIGSVIKKVLTHLNQDTGEDDQSEEDVSFFLKNGLALFNPSVEVVFNESGFLYREWTFTIVAREQGILPDLSELLGQRELDQDMMHKSHDEQHLVLEAVDINEDALLTIMDRFQCPVSIFGDFHLLVLCTDEDKLVNGFSKNHGSEMTLKAGIIAKTQYSPGFSEDSVERSSSEIHNGTAIFDSWSEKGNILRYSENKLAEDLIERLTKETTFKEL